MGKNQKKIQNKISDKKKGKPKRKSIKAKVTSQMGSKRRLSRMGKEMKKGMKGYAANYVTRSQILKRLQISLKDFRRLCILKGIYPRDPKKQVQGKSKTYYHIKDVSYLAHEPLLAKFRQFKAFMKKVRRSVGRGELSEAQRRNKAAPTYTLTHLIRERYPRFSDALSDLDDALCLVALFAYLPAEKRLRAERTDTCQRLLREWQYYVARSGSLCSTFVSIKGVYFQAQVQAQKITWVIPHQFTQHVPQEVDFRVMLTFLEFYEVFVKFTLFKLYHSIGLRYPPTFNSQLEELGCNLHSILAVPLQNDEEQGMDKTVISSKEKKEASTADTLKQQEISVERINSLDQKLREIQTMEEENEDEELGEALKKPLELALKEAVASEIILQDGDEAGEIDFAAEETESDQRKKLFKGLTFFLAREVPRGWVEFVILSYGGRVGWDAPGSPFDAKDKSITHHVVDRGGKGHLYFNREYVQPQWIFDSANNMMLLPVLRYGPTAELPPHLSPFVDNEAEGYCPAYAAELEALKAAGKGKAFTSRHIEEAADNQEVPEPSEEDEEKQFSRELQQEARGVTFSSAKASADGINKGETLEEEIEPTDEQAEEAEESEKDVLVKVEASKPKGTRKSKQKEEEKENHEMAQIMMSKKAKRLYGRMQHGMKKKQAAIDILESKRIKHEKKGKV